MPVDIAALRAATGLVWSEEPDDDSCFVDRANADNGLFLYRVDSERLWTASDGTDTADAETPTDAALLLLAAVERRRLARPGFRNMVVRCCQTCTKASFGYEGEITCGDNDSPRTVDPLNLCDNYT